MVLQTEIFFIQDLVMISLLKKNQRNGGDQAGPASLQLGTLWSLLETKFVIGQYSKILTFEVLITIKIVNFVVKYLVHMLVHKKRLDWHFPPLYFGS